MINNFILTIFMVLLFLTACKEKEIIEKNKSKIIENTNIQIFVDKSKHLGLNFKHFNGMDGVMYYPEIMGPGVALFDYDNDGDLDVYLGQGGSILESSKDSFGRLFRNDLEDDKIIFTDVTVQSGLLSYDYSMGIAIGDINNDGFVDVYLSNYGNNQMFVNLGNGKFKNVTIESNSQDSSFSTSSAFVDIDNDGDLDLYVANYVDFDLSTHKTCKNQTGADDYCGPNSYPYLHDKLLKNDGNGVFVDISNGAGITLAGAGLGVVTADFNADGYNDIYVTNDMMHNYMWINNHDGTFSNDALLRGNAVNFHGNAEASMGVDAGDIDNDGDLDLFMTHLLNETNTVYANNGSGYFTDVTTKVGLAEPSKGHTGFGTAFIDYDNDGWLDILAANGAVRRIEPQAAKGIKLPLNQSNQLFHNINGVFTDVTNQVKELQIENVSRGLAIGDIDNDGDTDSIITNINEYPQVLINQVGQNNNWIGFDLVDEKGKYLVGSSVSVKLDDSITIKRRSRRDASFISANDPRVLIGLGNHNNTVDIVINWANGKKQQLKSLEINKYHTIKP